MAASKGGPGMVSKLGCSSAVDEIKIRNLYERERSFQLEF
jgi:hypothetical protein